MTTAMDTAQKTTQQIVIEPPRGWQPLSARELWGYREMIWRLTLRDIKSRYKQSVLGPTWVILIPLAQAGIFSLIFGALAGFPSGDIPYPVFVFAGMVVWSLFSRGFQQTGQSISANENLITKVYFPRLVAPIAALGGSIIDFALGIVILSVLLLITGVAVPWTVIFAPLYVAFAMLCAIGVGIWIAAFSVKFRDLRYATPFLVQIMMWMTPVAWSSQILFENDRLGPTLQRALEIAFQLNPLFVAVDGFRWAVTGYIYGQPTIYTAVSVALTLLVSVTGLMYFRRIDATVADVI